VPHRTRVGKLHVFLQVLTYDTDMEEGNISGLNGRSGESREMTGYFRISYLNSLTFNLLVCAIKSNFGNVNMTYHLLITHIYIRLVETSTRDVLCLCRGLV
jgi:hypothetical protein